MIPYPWAYSISCWLSLAKKKPGITFKYFHSFPAPAKLKRVAKFIFDRFVFAVSGELLQNCKSALQGTERKLIKNLKFHWQAKNNALKLFHFLKHRQRVKELIVLRTFPPECTSNSERQRNIHNEVFNFLHCRFLPSDHSWDGSRGKTHY